MADQSRRSAKNLVRRAWHAIARTPEAPAADPATEACLGCGESTAVGTVFYSDRHVIRNSDGTNAYLCSLCNARLRSSRTGKRLTDDEVRNAVNNGSAAAYLWGESSPITH